MGTSDIRVSQFDPILFEVIRNALIEATEEMAACLQRSSYSTNIKTRLDHSSGYVDAHGRMVAQAFCQPAHLVTIGRLVPRAVVEYGPERLSPGDALVVNDPHRQGSHLNDIFVISPFFFGAELLGYVVNICHHVDVGGGAPASIGVFREIYQEGLILPVVKLVARGQIVADLLKIVLANVRAKKEVAGDLRAQIAANEIGIRRLMQIFGRYGTGTVAFYIDRLIEYSERRIRAELLALPRGIFHASDQLDDDGITAEPIHLEARITRGEDRIAFDFTGTDVQRAAPMNCNLTQTFTACVYVLKCLLDPDIPLNDGFYRPICVIAPEGSAVNATQPTAIVGGWEVAMRLCELLFKALSDAMPERVPAGTKGTVCQVGFGGRDSANGDYYCFYETVAGGYGGRFGTDGPDAVQTHFQNTQNAPIEETELNYPVRILRYSLIPDSEGPGRWRGGLEICREYAFVNHDAVFTMLADRAKFPALGLFEGEEGKTSRYQLVSNGRITRIPSKGTIRVTPRDMIRVESPGGGGYGPPRQRDAELVLEDVQQGKVSSIRARERYGVAIDTIRWVVDEEETRELRNHSP